MSLEKPGSPGPDTPLSDKDDPPRSASTDGADGRAVPKEEGNRTGSFESRLAVAREQRARVLAQRAFASTGQTPADVPQVWSEATAKRIENRRRARVAASERSPDPAPREADRAIPTPGDPWAAMGVPDDRPSIASDAKRRPVGRGWGLWIALGGLLAAGLLGAELLGAGFLSGG